MVHISDHPELWTRCMNPECGRSVSFYGYWASIPKMDPNCWGCREWLERTARIGDTARAHLETGKGEDATEGPGNGYRPLNPPAFGLDMPMTHQKETAMSEKPT